MLEIAHGQVSLAGRPGQVLQQSIHENGIVDLTRTGRVESFEQLRRRRVEFLNAGHLKKRRTAMLGPKSNQRGIIGIQSQQPVDVLLGDFRAGDFQGIEHRVHVLIGRRRLLQQR